VGRQRRVVNRSTLEPSYRATTYRIDAPEGPIRLRIGQPSPALDRLLGALPAAQWAFVTAHNPGSRRLGTQANQRRHAALKQEIDQRALRHYPGQGVGDCGTWPPEESFLIVGINEETAIALGRQFGQAAVVVGEAGGPARLAWSE
jgi:hypothetical protein